MTWATLAILIMARQVLPSWPATVAAGLLSGLAIATRTGGIITHAYLLAALILCAAGFFAENGRLPARYLGGSPSVMGRPSSLPGWPRSRCGHGCRSATPSSSSRSRWCISPASRWRSSSTIGASGFGPTPCRAPTFRGSSPRGCRKPFSCCWAVAFAFGCQRPAHAARDIFASWRIAARGLRARGAGAGAPARHSHGVRGAILPLAFLSFSVRRFTTACAMCFRHSDAGRHCGCRLDRAAAAAAPHPVIAALAAGAYVGHVVVTLAVLHPLEYAAMNARRRRHPRGLRKVRARLLVVAATEALRRLEHRLDYDPALHAAEAPPSILICIPWREGMVRPMMRRPWTIEIDAEKADFVIATERWRCATAVRDADRRGQALRSRVRPHLHARTFSGFN